MPTRTPTDFVDFIATFVPLGPVMMESGGGRAKRKHISAAVQPLRRQEPVRQIVGRHGRGCRTHPNLTAAVTSADRARHPTQSATTRQPSFLCTETNPHALNRWPDRPRAATMGH